MSEQWKIGDRVMIRTDTVFGDRNDNHPTLRYHGWLVAIGPQQSLVCYGIDKYMPCDTRLLVRRKPIPLVKKCVWVIQTDNRTPEIFHSEGDFKLSEHTKLLAKIEYTGEGREELE